MIQLRRLLLALQAAHCIVSRAARHAGPAGMRLSMPRGMPEVANDNDEARARVYLAAVDAIADDRVRRVVALMIATNDCDPLHTERSAVAVLGIPQSSLRRLLRRGLEEIAAQLEDREMAA